MSAVVCCNCVCCVLQAFILKTYWIIEASHLHLVYAALCPKFLRTIKSLRYQYEVLLCLYLLADCCVLVKVCVYDDELRTELLPDEARHGCSHPVPPRDVVRGRLTKHSYTILDSH